MLERGVTRTSYNFALIEREGRPGHIDPVAGRMTRGRADHRDAAGEARDGVSISGRRRTRGDDSGQEGAEDPEGRLIAEGGRQPIRALVAGIAGVRQAVMATNAAGGRS